MTDLSSWAAALVGILVLGAPSAQAAGICDLEGARILAGTDGIGGTGFSDSDGIGGTGHSDEDGIGGTGISSTDGIGGTGISDEDGIGGTGIYGTLTRFGSLCVNGVHILLGEETRYRRNGETSDLDEIAVGQVLWVRAQDTPGGLQARSVEALSAVVGTVASVDAEAGTLTVEGQTVLLGDSGEPGGEISASLPGVGDFIDVSGLRNDDDQIVVSRIEFLAEPTRPYRAPGLRELIDAAPELRALSVEGFLGPEIGPDRFRLAGIRVEAPELATLSENTRIWLTGGRVGPDTLAVRRAEFKPSSPADSRDRLSPDGSREPIELPEIPADESKKSGLGEPPAPILLAPERDARNTLEVPMADRELNGAEALSDIEVEIQPIVDDALIDSLIDLDNAIKIETPESDTLDSHQGIPGADSSILVPVNDEKIREKIETPVLIESIGVEPRMDSPGPIMGD